MDDRTFHEKYLKVFLHLYHYSIFSSRESRGDYLFGIIQMLNGCSPERMKREFVLHDLSVLICTCLLSKSINMKWGMFVFLAYSVCCLLLNEESSS